MDKNGDALTRRVRRRRAVRPVALIKWTRNNDGKISRDEWKGNPKRFDRLDANGDGVITKEEIRGGRVTRQ